SMVMASLFLGSRVRRELTVAHCNFHLRGTESDGDEAFVREWAETRGLRFVKADFETEEYSKANGISVEMAARELRYAWFSSLCEKESFDAVAVAHNANDNAETLFLNLLRGTGLKGIRGMRDSSFINGSDSARLVRPLLGFSRKDIHEYAIAQGIPWREDSTNSDSAYKRNLLRNEVFPLLERINPSFLETITSDIARFDQAGTITDDFVAYHAPKVARREGSGIVIDSVRLYETPRWEYLLYRLLEPYGFNESVIGDLISLIKDGSTFSGRRFLAKEYCAETSRKSIIVSALRPLRQAQGQVRVEMPGEYSLDGIRFVVDVVEVEDPVQPEGTTVAAIGFPFTVRRWQAGDWMRPLGMKGCRKKLSDMFTDLKFSSARKERALVISDEGSHVLALIGYRVDQSAALPAPPVGEPSGKLTTVHSHGPFLRIRLI
ncbi:MAG: tRNA lysidine(34) synthetase TilS, partial [Bacteroidales bacterium]|nr:tRNA lysidine(34) synthetase TilS [Bacteroidales bacterium]